MRILVLAVLLLSALAWTPHAALAATTCTATMTDVNFGTFDPVAGATTVGTLNYSCTTSGVSAGTNVRILACFSIGDGAAGDALTIVPRRMTQSGTNPPYLNFNLYTDAGYASLWGTFWQPSYPPPQVSLSRTGNGTVGGTLTAYGRIPAGQTALPPGAYTDAFSAGHTTLDYRYREGSGSAPSDCRTGGTSGASGGSFSFTARATVVAACTITTATNLAFPSPTNLLTTNIDQTSTIGLTCTNGAPWQVGLGNGSNASGTQRRMRLGTTANYVNYELYRDATRSQRWGGTLNSDTATGTGTGSAQNVTVYGRVPPQSPMPPAGAYKDTIVVTVTY